jgi:hypothetical protein
VKGPGADGEIVSNPGEAAGPASFGGRFNASMRQWPDRPPSALIWIKDVQVANVSQSITIAVQILSKSYRALYRVPIHAAPKPSKAHDKIGCARTRMKLLLAAL